MPRPPPPQTALTKTGKPISCGRRLQGVEVGAGLGATQRRQAGVASGRDGAGLVAGEVQHRRRRADEGDAGRVARLGEERVLGEEAVAGVDRVGAGLDGLRHDRLVVEVGADRVALLADLVGLVGLEPVLALAVLVGEDGDRAGAELGRGPEGSDGDLASVGDENLAEHRTSRVRGDGVVRVDHVGSLVAHRAHASPRPDPGEAAGMTWTARAFLQAYCGLAVERRRLTSEQRDVDTPHGGDRFRRWSTHQGKRVEDAGLSR